jgi:RimJ/RimL family protein N-acetyltransferase
MIEKNVILTLSGHPDLRLREINSADLENLRTWKNENKNSFFLKEEITPEQQRKWYTNFSQREHDHMFIVEQEHNGDWEPIGCMGFRKLDDEGCIDGYNIIRSKKIEPASFSMSDAFGGMLAYAASLHPRLPLYVKVLSHNPAVAWYEKNNFKTIDEKDGYVLMDLDKQSLKKYSWSIK